MGKQQIEKAPDRIWFIVNAILLGIFFISELAILVQLIIVHNTNYPLAAQFGIAIPFLFVISFITCILYTLFLPKEVKYRQFGKIFWGVFLGSALGFAIIPEKLEVVFFVLVISFIACIFHTLFLPKKTKWRQLGWIVLVTILSFTPLLIKSISSYIRSLQQDNIGDVSGVSLYGDKMNSIDIKDGYYADRIDSA